MELLDRPGRQEKLAVMCAFGHFYRHLEGIDRSTWKRDNQTGKDIKKNGRGNEEMIK